MNVFDDPTGRLPFVGAIIVAAGVLLGPPLMRRYQNAPGRLGGPIAAAKARWLVHAMVLWYVVPACLLGQAPVFTWLFVSMVVRAIVEIPLCLKMKWRVAYGLGHDAIHLGLCGLGWPGSAPWVKVWLAVTMVSLLCEIGFVLVFRSSTEGPANGIYFVPDEAKHRRILLITDALLAPQTAVILAACVLRLVP